MNDKKKNIIFVVYTYALCWLLMLVAIMIGAPQNKGIFIQLIMLFIPWTPTIALLVLFKKLYPETSIKYFYRKAFQERVNIRLLLFITIIQTIISVGASGVIAYTKGVSIGSVVNLSPQSILMSIVITLVTGAAGEESGWRGFLQSSLEKRFSVIKASVIIGIIWGFWHVPQWFATSGFYGIELIQYILSFMLSIISIAVIMGICYNRCKNLLVPMWLHFMFNLIAPSLTISILNFMMWYAVFYVVAAIGYSIWYIRVNRH